jgi:ferredoxin
MKTRLLNINDLTRLSKRCREAEENFIAPVRVGAKVMFRPVQDNDQVVLDELFTANSIKEFFFPRCEKILSYRKGTETKIEDSNPVFPEAVIFACRPCDAAAPPVLDKVFQWDCNDAFFLERRQKTVVIAAACLKPDKVCFCTSMGLSNISEKGSDIMMFQEGEKLYLKPITEKGENWLDKRQITEETEIPAELTQSYEKAAPEKKFPLEKIKPWLDKNFENADFFKKISARCIGCGVCTHVCPVCHCFDIVDEGGFSSGCRLKNWDSCSFGLFTKHTSGHNPRTMQFERWRQRMSHKFRYYKERFDEYLCTGCGRCVRECSVNMGVLETLMEIGRMED